jgi:hypothetical protein
MDLQRNMLADLPQCIPHAITGDAPADRVYAGSKGKDLIANVTGDKVVPGDRVPTTNLLATHDFVWTSTLQAQEPAESTFGALV